MAALTPRTASPAPSTASSFVDDARDNSTRAIYDGTTGKKPRIEFLEFLNSGGLHPDFAEQLPSDGSSAKAIYHGSRPPVYPPATSNPASPLPRLAALRGKSYREQRLELGGLNPQTPQGPDIAEWQNATEESENMTNEDSWMGKSDRTSATESTVAEEMEEQQSEGGKSEGVVNEEDRRRRMLLEKATKESR